MPVLARRQPGQRNMQRLGDFRSYNSLKRLGFTDLPAKAFRDPEMVAKERAAYEKRKRDAAIADLRKICGVTEVKTQRKLEVIKVGDIVCLDGAWGYVVTKVTKERVSVKCRQWKRAKSFAWTTGRISRR